MHRRVFIDGEIDTQRLKSFERKVQAYEKRGFCCGDYRHVLDKYKEIKK